MWRLIDRARVGELPDRLAWLILGFGMVVSFGLAMWFGRNSWYSVDEQVWLTESADFSLGTAFSDHYGHLVLVPRVLYKLIFATLGTGYLPFRLLSLFAIFLTVALLFVVLKRRLPAFVALAPCLVLLVFPVDPWNYLVGNGFFVLLPVACGLAALICLERQNRTGDFAAFGLLCFGILTCTFVCHSLPESLWSSCLPVRIVTVPGSDFCRWLPTRSGASLKASRPQQPPTTARTG